MSIPPAERVPSVFITFRKQPAAVLKGGVVHHPSHPTKTTPASVNFPDGHAFTPKYDIGVVSFAQSIRSFSTAVASILEQPTQEETTPKTKPLEIPPETVRPLKQAFELLQSQLQEGIHLLPETKQPLPKALLQALVQTPVFIEQLRELLQKTSPKQPIFEEAEIPIKLPVGPRPELKVLEELQRNIPSFVKNLQVALQELPQALPLEIKEALQKYLLSPSLQKALPTAQEEVKAPLQKAPAIQKATPPLVEQPKVFAIQKPGVSLQEVIVPSKAILIKKQVAQIALPEALVAEEHPSKIQTKPLQKEEVLSVSQYLAKEEALPTKPPLQAKELEKPSLARLPEVALREALEGFYPLMKILLGLLQKEKLIPKELIALLKQMPVSIEQLKQVFEKNPALLTFEEKEVLKTLQRSIPTLFGNLKMELLNLPKFLFPEIRQNLGKYVQEFPLEELAAFIQKRVKASSEIVAPSPWEMPALPEEAPVKTEKVEISQPSIIIPSINPEVLFEELMVAETQLNEIGKVYPHHVGGRREVEGRGKEMVGAQGALAVISTKEFKEQVKVPPMPPEFSTDIPFAFIVPYVPNTPIHTPPPEVKITPHDPMKEPLKEDSGDRKKKSVQMFAYVPEGEAWIGDPAAEGSVKKLLLPSYAIGVYLVTNQQFADFLTEQSKLKGISVGDRGQIFSKDKGLLLCQIKSGTVESDIEVEPQENYLSFSVISEKESYPVVCVTYDGAKAFCLAGGFRLPTEVEWEKAASLEMTEKNKVNKKFTFGCSQDEITPAFANYGTKSSSSLETFTTPVGFYNGKSSFMKEGLLIQTFDARSPFGCYDMSGNVWEWVEGENGNPLIKGGCFLSGEEDLKVFLKKEKSANSLDGYTGFRVALS